VNVVKASVSLIYCHHASYSDHDIGKRIFHSRIHREGFGVMLDKTNIFSISNSE